LYHFFKVIFHEYGMELLNIIRMNESVEMIELRNLSIALLKITAQRGASYRGNETATEASMTSRGAESQIAKG
jgi:hypothetical protein